MIDDVIHLLIIDFPLNESINYYSNSHHYSHVIQRVTSNDDLVLGNMTNKRFRIKELNRLCTDGETIGNNTIDNLNNSHQYLIELKFEMLKNIT